MKKPLQIPFNETGQMHYPEVYWGPIDWRENFTFADTLHYVDYARGRSAAYFIFESAATKQRYTMFMTDFDELIKQGHAPARGITSVWTFSKRGQNFGIREVA